MLKPHNWYQQSAVIPYRLTPQTGGASSSVEILLITSRKRKRWVIPKGIVEPDMSPLESALKEAYEEAGIRGRAEDAVFGVYAYNKWHGICRVKVFLLEVAEVLSAWPEAWERDREWVTVDEAASRVRESDLKKLLFNVPNALAQKRPYERRHPYPIKALKTVIEAVENRL